MFQVSWRSRALMLAVVSFGSFVTLEAALPDVAHAAGASHAALGGTLVGLAAVVFAASAVASAFCVAATRGWRRLAPVAVNLATIVWLYLRD